MNNSIVAQGAPENQQEFLSMAEVAHAKNKSLRSVQQSIKKYKNFLEGYVYKKYHRCSISGNRRKMTVISNQGLIKLLTLMDGERSKSEAKLRNLKGKEKVAETAIQSVTPSADPILANLQQMMLVRQEQLRQQGQLDSMKADLDMFKQDRQEAIALLGALPVSETKPPEMTTRAKITQRINAYARAKGNYKECRRTLYGKLYYIYHINVNKRVGEGENGMDIIEEAGLIEQTWDLCCDMFRLPEEKASSPRPYHED